MQYPILIISSYTSNFIQDKINKENIYQNNEFENPIKNK